MFEIPKDEKPATERHIQALEEVYKVQNDLLDTINEMDTKIQEVIRCHEAEFLIAYRNHIKNIKQELAEMKQRAEEQQKRMMSNERAVFLEKQIILFREEALRLYNKLQERVEENDGLKNSCRELQKVNAFLDKENKEHLKEIRILETQKALAEQQTEVINLQKQALKEQFEMFKSKKSKIKASQGITTHSNGETGPLNNKFTTPKQQSYLPMPLNTRIGGRKTEPRLRELSGLKLNQMKAKKRISTQLLDHQVKNWFVECLETIRKEIGQRKVYGSKSDDINSIGSWEEFRMIDKLRLLEMFMQNEKLLVWMYQKVFPTRLNELEAYFQNKKNTIVIDSRSKSKSMSINMGQVILDDPLGDVELKSNGQSKLQVENPMLPKVGLLGDKKREKKYDVRARIEMKNGKLNLSQFND